MPGLELLLLFHQGKSKEKKVSRIATEDEGRVYLTANRSVYRQVDSSKLNPAEQEKVRKKRFLSRLTRIT